MADSASALDERIQVTSKVTSARGEAKALRRFDPPAMSQLGQWLLHLGHGVCGAASVLTVGLLSRQLGMQLQVDWRVWAVLLAVLAAAMPVHDYSGFHQPRLALRLKVMSALLNACVAVVALQLLCWAAGLTLLPVPLGLLMLAVLGAYSLLVRGLIEQLSKRWRDKTRLLIVGAGAQGVAIAKHLASTAPGVEVVGFIDARKSRRMASKHLPYPLLASIEQLESLPADIDGVVIALPNTAGARVDELAAVLRQQTPSVYLAPELAVLQHTCVGWSNAEPQMVLKLGMSSLPLEARLCKRLFDIVFASAALLLFLPFGLVIALLIKLESPGPVLFRQQRYGRGNQLFSIYKFRSMAFDPAAASKTIRLAERGDSRVTRLGEFLRRTSLDEFPQFLNVLLGQMSVVGPRPHPPGVMAGRRVYEAVVADFVERYKVRPGITGWAQVNGLRGSTFTEQALIERFTHDIEYLRNWSLELDLWIVLKTILGGFGGKNAF